MNGYPISVTVVEVWVMAIRNVNYDSVDKACMNMMVFPIGVGCEQVSRNQKLGSSGPAM